VYFLNFNPYVMTFLAFWTPGPGSWTGPEVPTPPSQNVLFAPLFLRHPKSPRPQTSPVYQFHYVESDFTTPEPMRGPPVEIGTFEVVNFSCPLFPLSRSPLHISVPQTPPGLKFAPQTYFLLYSPKMISSTPSEFRLRSPMTSKWCPPTVRSNFCPSFCPLYTFKSRKVRLDSYVFRHSPSFATISK